MTTEAKKTLTVKLVRSPIGCKASHRDTVRGLGLRKVKKVRKPEKTIASLEKPLVAAVDGIAIGIGTTMLLHCDYVVASEWSTFSAPFVDLGLTPEAGSSLLAPRLMGHQRAFELFVMGEQFDAQRAHQAGFVNKVVPAEALMDTALGYARRIAANAPLALQAAKELALRGRDMDLATGLRMEQVVNRLLMATDDAREGPAAFAEKRAPQFKGK